MISAASKGCLGSKKISHKKYREFLGVWSHTNIKMIMGWEEF